MRISQRAASQTQKINKTANAASFTSIISSLSLRFRCSVVILLKFLASIDDGSACRIQRMVQLYILHLYFFNGRDRVDTLAAHIGKRNILQTRQHRFGVLLRTKLSFFLSAGREEAHEEACVLVLANLLLELRVAARGPQALVVPAQAFLHPPIAVRDVRTKELHVTRTVFVNGRVEREVLRPLDYLSNELQLASLTPHLRAKKG